MKEVTSTWAKKGRQALILFATFAFATFLLYRCFRQVDLALFIRQASQVNPLFLVSSVFILGAIIFITAAQWRMFLPEPRKIPLRRVAEVVSMTLMTANTMPWGHTAAAYLLGREKKVGHAVALSVWTADQMMGGVAKVLIYLVVTYTAPLPEWLKHAIRGYILLNIVGYAFFLAVGYWGHEGRRKKKENILQGWWHRLVHFASQWAHHLDTLRDVRKIFWGVFCALGMKVCEAASIFLIQRALGLDLPLSASWVLVVALNLATMFPVAPGNLGVYESAAFYLYRYWGVDPTQAMTLSVFHHLVYLIPMVIPGYLLVLKRGVKVGAEPAPDPSSAGIEPSST
jgi:uncharacterized protein (TIRG00374 family)